MKGSSIEVGVIAEQTGALPFMGRANANVAKMVVDDIDAESGLRIIAFVLIVLGIALVVV